jgi:hypothetical protein
VEPLFTGLSDVSQYILVIALPLASDPVSMAVSELTNKELFGVATEVATGSSKESKFFLQDITNPDNTRI